MKYKVGDRVKVREDLREGQKYGNYNAVCSMLAFRGKNVTLESGNNCHKIDGSHCAWTDEMFSGYATGADSVDWKRAKKEKIAVICPTEREYIALMEDCKKRGYRWASCDTPMSKCGAQKTLVYLHTTQRLTWGTAAHLESDNPNLPAYTYRLPESEEVTAPPAPERQLWRLEIWSDGDKTHAEMRDENGNTIARETVTRYYADEYSCKAAIEALTAKLFRPEPKFRAGDIVSCDHGYYRIAKPAEWSGNFDNYRYEMRKGPGEWMPYTSAKEPCLTLVCRAEDVAK